MELIQIMEAVTLIVTLGMTMTGIPPCLNMYKTKSTRNVPFPIFLLSAISCSGMFHYGLMMGNGVLVFLNAVGSVMQTVYISMFVVVVKSKTKSLFFLTLAVLYVSGLYFYLYNVLDTESQRADTLGMCCGLITTGIMCLPALEVVSNIRHKNADGMPLVMLVGGAMCSSCWLVYGIMLNDPNVFVPNIPGLFIVFTKLYIISLYGEREKKIA